MDEQLEKIKRQHFTTYKSAIIETIKNNTSVLTDQDLTSLLEKPPLDSMDSIKLRFLTLAKKNKIILNTESLSKLLDSYRKNLVKCVKKIKKIRNDYLIEKVECFDDTNAVIKILKKDFNVINKKIKVIFKDSLNDSLKTFLKNINCIFQDDTDESLKNKIITDITKFLNGSYKRQVIENVDIKVLIKDTTLINLIKEQTERHLFTMANSRLFKDNI